MDYQQLQHPSAVSQLCPGEPNHPIVVCCTGVYSTAATPEIEGIHPGSGVELRWPCFGWLEAIEGGVACWTPRLAEAMRLPNWEALRTLLPALEHVFRAQRTRGVAVCLHHAEAAALARSN